MCLLVLWFLDLADEGDASIGLLGIRVFIVDSDDEGDAVLADEVDLVVKAFGLDDLILVD